MYYFCTYFDKNFLTRGLALYHSLAKQEIEFTLYILCLDEESFTIIEKLNYPQINPIHLDQIENYFPDLLSVKNDRTVVEYYWTLTPYLPLYLLMNSSCIDIIAYMDADLFFYQKPQCLYDEFGDNSVFIIPHRLNAKDKKNEIYWGKYNVGYMMFRRDNNGLKTLKWWAEKCMEWCYYKVEENRAGDQKYLDYFSQISDNVLSCDNLGAGIGNWNLHYYNYELNNDDIYISSPKNLVIFCHFNKAYILNDRGWIINKSSGFKNYRILLKPYANFIYKAIREVETIQSDYEYGYEKVSFKEWVICILKRQIFKGKLKQTL